ncbi:MAG: hypothetical protein ACE5HB_08725, partial [Terriglobia bacterium]
AGCRVHVPGWHEATKALQKEGKVQMVGILQEQHPERARLFMQWKQMGWPLLVDSLNLLEVPYVPITLLLDEHGVVRQIQPPRQQAGHLEENFLSKTFEKPADWTSAKTEKPDLAALRAATRANTAEAWGAYGNAAALWGGAAQASEAIRAYRRALQLEPADGWTLFRLGVAYRLRYDSGRRLADDFQRAVDHWKQALDTDPNQYIWRRRIQQYGPRLAKPYPFYDWVRRARQAIAARGETPVELRVEPGGAELARPARSFTTSPAQQEPDAQGRIYRDERAFVEVETTVVPGTVAPGEAARVHVAFRPNLGIKAHWNNEVDDLVFWVNPPAGWQVDAREQRVANPPQVVSQETRKVEFEVHCPPEAAAGTVAIPGYALYYVCEDVNGTCLYRRQDVALQVSVAEKGSR